MRLLFKNDDGSGTVPRMISRLSLPQILDLSPGTGRDYHEKRVWDYRENRPETKLVFY